MVSISTRSAARRGRPAPALRAAAAAALVAVFVSAGPAAAAPLALEEALRLTREANLNIHVARLGARAAAARVVDAGRRPNPEVEASAENFGGGRGGDLLETTVGLSQTFELGGDRSARAGTAAADADVARQESGRAIRDQEAVTAERFLDAWTLQERAVFLSLAVEQAREAVRTAEERHRAGAAPAFDQVRAETHLATREMERRRTGAALAVGIRFLATQWRGDAGAIDSLLLPAIDSIAVPDTAGVRERLRSHPDVLRARAEVRSREWRARAARGARVPDLTVGAGARRLEEPGTTAFVVGVSAPLPLWNPGKGAVAGADLEREAAELSATAVEAALAERALAARDDLSAAWAAYRNVREGVVPRAEEALRLIRGGYLAGRLGYLDILDSQRSLLEANLLLAETYADVWRARTRLERLTGVNPASEEETR